MVSTLQRRGEKSEFQDTMYPLDLGSYGEIQTLTQMISTSSTYPVLPQWPSILGTASSLVIYNRMKYSQIKLVEENNLSEQIINVLNIFLYLPIFVYLLIPSVCLSGCLSLSGGKFDIFNFV